MKPSVYARATVTLEIDVPSTWDGSAQMDQIMRQAKADAVGMITNAFLDTVKQHRVRLIGSPKITAVLATDGDDHA